MQDLFDHFRRKRQRAECDDVPGVVFGAGVSVPLADLAIRRLDELQLALTRTPRAPMGTPEPVQAYRLGDGCIRVPRCFGLSRFPKAADACSDGAPLSPEALRLPEAYGGLRGHQVSPAAAALARLAAPPHSAVLCLRCGAGKTVVAIHVARALGRRFLVVVPRSILLEQWVERLGSFMPGASVGVLQGRRREFGRDATVATIQTLARLSPEEDLRLGDVGLLVVDEAHHFAARLFSEVFFRVPARHVLGLSATPERRDGLTELLAHYMGGVLAFDEEPHRARGAGVLRVLLPRPAREAATPLEMQRLRTALASDAARNAAIVELARVALSCRRRSLLLSDRVAHLEALRRGLALPESDPRLRTITGASRGEERRVPDDCHLVLATFGMAAEGLDVPSLDCLILAAAASEVTQAVGRVLRSAEGKREPRVIDLVDGGPFHGAGLMRQRQYASWGFAVRERRYGPELLAELAGWLA